MLKLSTSETRNRRETKSKKTEGIIKTREEINIIENRKTKGKAKKKKIASLTTWTKSTELS